MADGRLAGKVAIVTGGASGIGAASVKRFIAEGALVVAADRDIAGARALAEQTSLERCLPYEVDVTDQRAITSMVQAATERFGKLDILFNNAGGGSIGATPDLQTEEWKRVFALNVDSVFFACHAAIPVMAAGGGGVIINTASISGLRGDRGGPAYGTSKAAVINYTRCLAVDHADDKIRVNAICPGFIQTPLTEVAKSAGLVEEWVSTVPMRRAGLPEEIASVATFLASDDASFVTGAVIVADGGKDAGSGQPDFRELARRAAG